MKVQTKLARVFSTLAQEAQKTESTAAEIFAIVKEGAVRTVKKWDKLVRDAYQANGWNTRPGRPAAGEAPKGDVPDTVRTYATIVRQAIRSGLRLGRYQSFTALRTDLLKHRGSTGMRGTRAANDGVTLPKAVREDFVGVSVQTPKEPNGALFHDLGAVYIGLPAEQRDLLGRQLNRLLHKYLPLARTVRALPAPREERKAA